MIRLDHIAIGCTDLDEGTAWAEAQLGVPLKDGGKHARYGTHNRLLGLGDGLYLEVIAVDPLAEHHGPRWFGLEHFQGAPRLANWICATDAFDQTLAGAGGVAGTAVSLERGDLRWRIAVPDDGSLPMGGGYPTLIEWASGTRHPSDRLGPSGVTLLDWTVVHPQAEWLGAALPRRPAAPPIHFETGPAPAFRARFSTPLGIRTLT